MKAFPCKSSYVDLEKIWIILTVSKIWNDMFEHAVGYVIGYWKIILNGLIWFIWYELVLHFWPVTEELVSEKMAVETQPSTDAEISGLLSEIFWR